MRLLFTTMPAASHLMHLVPLAQAAQAAGHEVVVASGGGALDTAKASGLVGFEVGADRDAAAPYRELVARLTSTAHGIVMADEPLMAYYGEVFGQVGVRMIEQLIEFGRAWRADAVVYPGIHAAGLIVARELGLPAVLHGIGTPRPTFAPALDYIACQLPELAGSADSEADIQVDVSPPSLLPIVHGSPDGTGPPTTFPMRYLPQSVGCELPPWLLEPQDRARLLVTFGSMPAMGTTGSLYRTVLEAAPEDVELVFTAAGAALTDLPAELPERIRVVDWLPLLPAMRAVTAVVHHGGMGSIYSAFVAARPQLSIPRAGMDCVANAEVVAARGAGLTVQLSDASPETVAPAIRAVLDQPRYAVAARAVGAEIASMPSPAMVAAQLAEVLA